MQKTIDELQELLAKIDAFDHTKTTEPVAFGNLKLAGKLISLLLEQQNTIAELQRRLEQLENQVLQLGR